MSFPLCLPPLPLPDEMRQWDLAAFALGLPEIMLMENASRAALEALASCCAPLRHKRIWLFMGSGNNGGDAAALARHLLDAGACPTVWHTRPLRHYGGACGRHVRMARACGVPFLPVSRCPWQAPVRELPHIVVDGLLGTGFHGELRPDMLDLIRRINGLRPHAFLFALDVPSGLDTARGLPCPDAVRAHATVTFEAAKWGLVLPESASFTGRLLVLPIGIPAAVRRSAPCSARLLPDTLPDTLPGPHARGYKGSYGHVLVLGGAEGLSGAAHLAARAALRAGAGLVTAVTPSANLAAVKNGLAEIMVLGLDAADQTDSRHWPVVSGHGLPQELRSLLARCSALVLGPGMGRSEAALTLLAAVLRTPQRPPAVLDADALSLLAGHTELLRDLRPHDVLTPHPGEAAALLGSTSAAVQADRCAALRRLCALTPACVVLKGAGTLVACRTTTGAAPICLCPRDVPALSAGGSGDVLAGCLGALLARQDLPGQENALYAACCAVVWHVRAGQRLSARFPARGTLAHELADQLPLVRQPQNAQPAPCPDNDAPHSTGPAGEETAWTWN